MNAFQSVPSQLTLALFKGCVFEETPSSLKAVGIEMTEDPETSRKLILPTSDPALCVIIVRASDVPTYVQYSTTDSGVASRDVLMEHGMADLHAPTDLNTARCHMPVAVPKGFGYANAMRQGACPSVATKYPNTAREHFAKKGVHVDLIKLYGSMELGPLAGLADAIVDLASTDGTLCTNNLVEIEEIVQISPRLVVNQAALKLKRDRLVPTPDAFERASVTDARAGEAA